MRGLVYPVPDPAFRSRYAHFTRGIDGGLTAGPNAVLALAREGTAGSPSTSATSATSSRSRASGAWRGRISAPVRRRSGAISSSGVCARDAPVLPADGDDVTFGPSGVRAQCSTVTARSWTTSSSTSRSGPFTSATLPRPRRRRRLRSDRRSPRARWPGSTGRSATPNVRRGRASATLGGGRGIRPAPHQERLRDRPCDASATDSDRSAASPDGCVERDEGGFTRVSRIPRLSRLRDGAPLEATGTCSRCFGPLDPVYDWDALRATVTRERLASGPLSIWRYAELLPVSAPEQARLAPGFTPLVPRRGWPRRSGSASCG